jgi:two-component system response regulator AlgR
VNILIVDDEAPARERLRQLVADSGEHQVIGEAGNGTEALALAHDLEPDVVLLDIRMPGLSGIETAHHFNSLDKPPAVVFTTAYDEYAIEAFEAQAIGYVLKPVRRERLERALAQAARLSNNDLGEVAEKTGQASRRQHLCVRMHGELKLIPLTDVHYFLADQKYVRVHHGNGEDLIEDSLKMLEQEFSEDFVRIHRSALVALSQIDSLVRTADGQMLIKLRGSADEGEEGLAISRRHVAEVRRQLKKG